MGAIPRMRCVGFEQLSISGAAGFTAANMRGATFARVTFDGAVRVREDGSNPTASVGSLFNSGDSWWCDNESLGNVKFIAVSGTVPVNVTYYNEVT